MIAAIVTALLLDTAALPVDTLLVDSQRIVGVAAPAQVWQVPGDFNNDGTVGPADIISLVRFVFLDKPLPGGDTVCISVTRTDALGVKTMFTFVPRRPGVR